MKGREKKPPININELRKSTQPEMERGTLDYAGSPKGSSNGEKKGSGGLVQILLPIVVALALAVLVMFQYAPSKGYVLNLRNEIFGRITVIESKLGDETKRIDAIVNAMGDYAKRTELAAYASKASVDSLSGLPAQIDTKISALEGKYNTKLTDLGTNITKLETKVTGGPIATVSGTGSTCSVTVTTPVSGTYIIRATLVYLTPVALTGDTSDNATANFYSRAGISRVYLPKLIYTGTGWKLAEIVFYSGSFPQDAGKTITYTMAFTLTDFGGYTLFAEVMTVSTTVSGTAGGI